MSLFEENIDLYELLQENINEDNGRCILMRRDNGSLEKKYINSSNDYICVSMGKIINVYDAMCSISSIDDNCLLNDVVRRFSNSYDDIMLLCDLVLCNHVDVNYEYNIYFFESFKSLARMICLEFKNDLNLNKNNSVYRYNYTKMKLLLNRFNDIKSRYFKIFENENYNDVLETKMLFNNSNKFLYKKM